MKFLIVLVCFVAVSFAEETETKGGMYKPGYGQGGYSSDYSKPNYNGAGSNDYLNGGYAQAGYSSDYPKPSYNGAGNDYHSSGYGGYGSGMVSYGGDYGSAGDYGPGYGGYGNGMGSYGGDYGSSYPQQPSYGSAGEYGTGYGSMSGYGDDYSTASYGQDYHPQPAYPPYPKY